MQVCNVYVLFKSEKFRALYLFWRSSGMSKPSSASSDTLASPEPQIQKNNWNSSRVLGWSLGLQKAHLLNNESTEYLK